ncbi:N-acetylneuraminate synthase family protein [Candidatus Omnitrophota bacterium]
MKDKKIDIIAEVGNLHDGSIDKAKRLIQISAECGADVVKFQTHIFDAESLLDAPAPDYFKQESRKDYFERTAFNAGQWKKLKLYAQECSIEFMSSVFSLEAVDLLEEVGVKRYKIPSGEVTNLSLLEKVASLRKPVLLSSGMSSWDELDWAVDTLRSGGCEDLIVLQCTSLYPCPNDKVGLNVINEIKKRYGCRVGFSDHTLNNEASFAAIAFGVEIIERHLTLSRDHKGSDAKHSLEPDEFKQFVRQVKDGRIENVDQAFFPAVDKDKLAEELKEMKFIFEKSIVAKHDIAQGTTITFDMLAFKKPGDGIRADNYRDIIGRKALQEISVNTKIDRAMLSEKRYA